MAEYKNISLDIDDGIALLQIRRPKVFNALSWKTLDELEAACKIALDDDKVQGIVLSAEGGAIAGADITELATVDSAQRGVDMCRRGQAVVAQFENANKPVVAALNGPVLGGGCELSMGAHARVVGPRLLLGQPEVNLGIIPGYGGTQRLPRLIGAARAADLLRTGRPIKAAEACAWGWAHGEPVDDVIAAARALIRDHLDAKITLAPVSPKALQGFSLDTDLDIGWHSKAIDGILLDVLRQGWSQTLAEGLEAEAQGFGRCIETEDVKIGLRNFIENGPRAKAEFVHR